MSTLRTVLTVAAVIAGFNAAMASQSIVGTWATPGKCGRPLSTIVIAPMSLSGEDFHCDFGKIVRKGDTVRWRGTCTFGVDTSTNLVTAKLSGGKLRYQIDRDGWNGPLQRCK